MTGVESVRVINGRPVTAVTLEGGSEEVLSELIVVPDRREKERADADPSLTTNVGNS
jgi:hypothetical protein